MALPPANHQTFPPVTFNVAAALGMNEGAACRTSHHEVHPRGSRCQREEPAWRRPPSSRMISAQSPILRDQPGRARRGATVTVHGPPLASLGRQELSCRRQGLAALPRPAPASRPVGRDHGPGWPATGRRPPRTGKTTRRHRLVTPPARPNFSEPIKSDAGALRLSGGLSRSLGVSGGRRARRRCRGRCSR